MSDSPVWIWLGSDNNKGAKTDWKQGIRALAVCSAREQAEGKQIRIELDNVFVLPDSVSKMELLRTDPEFYTEELSGASIVGLNNYASQVVQILREREFWAIGQMIAKLHPEVSAALQQAVGAMVGTPERQLSSEVAEDDDEIEVAVTEEEDEEPLISEVKAG